MVDRKSKILIGIFIFMMLISISITYYKYIVVKDFEIITDPVEFNNNLESNN